MQVVFRVDASNRIGTGHVTRCLTLADCLRTKGAECRFVHRLHPGHMADAIRNQGYPVTELPSPGSSEPAADGDYQQWLGIAQSEDAEQTIKALDVTTADWVVVDHYSLDASWEEAIRPYTQQIAVIDDLANRRHDCDLLLDQNYFPDAESRYDGLLPERTKRLCGPRYSPLRPEYTQARRFIGPRRGPLSRVLVYYGGTDPSNETARALRVLSRPEFSRLAADIVMGVNNPNREILIEQAKQRPLTDVHGPREHLVDLMIEADLAIGAGGSTTWERCALGLPSIVTGVAQNQQSFNKILSDESMIRYLGPSAELVDEDLAHAVRCFLNSSTYLLDIASRIWRMSDCLGTLRAAESLLPCDPQHLSLRPANRGDKTTYFDWVNDPEVRRSAHNPNPISWAEHDAWFENRLCSPHAYLWVLSTPSGLPVGQARAEVHNNEALLDYSIDSAFRAHGWGSRLLELVLETWRNSFSDLTLVGEVRTDNVASCRTFRRTGCFQETARPGGGCMFAYHPRRTSIANGEIQTHNGR